MSLELQQAFGLRREEAIKMSPTIADQGDRLVLKASWTKGGKAREIPIRTPEQRAALWRQHKLGERPPYRWQEAVERWVIESAAHASLEDSKIHLRWVHRFLYDVHLDAIDRTSLDKIVAARDALKASRWRPAIGC